MMWRIPVLAWCILCGAYTCTYCALFCSQVLISALPCLTSQPHIVNLGFQEPVTARTIASEPKLERMLYYEDTKLRKRRRGIYRRQGKQISREGRQGASDERANSRMAEYGRFWQVTRPSTVTECCSKYLIKKTDLLSVCGHLRRNSVNCQIPF